VNDPSVKRALNTVRDGQEITALHVLDGADTLLDASIQMELMARYWMHLHRLGWTLAEPGRGGVATLVQPAGWHQ
jgi:hypothetical protein